MSAPGGLEVLVSSRMSDDLPFRKLPTEIQGQVFQNLIGKPSNDAPEQSRLRKQARTNMLLLDRKAYNDFAAEFYQQAIFIFRYPATLINSIQRLRNDYLRNITALCWRNDRGWLDGEDVQAWVHVLFSLPKLSHLQKLEFDQGGRVWQFLDLSICCAIPDNGNFWRQRLAGSCLGGGKT